LVLGESSLLNVGALDDAAFRRSSLVVLSACSSANGITGAFADRDSLARQLVSKGVPEVVASRWLVNSKATALLMAAFYTELSRKLTVAEALQKAALSLRTQQEFSHPFYWAGFSVFGKG
jgi:CHAT domain-containing protein